MVEIKFCGLTRAEDAAHAVESGGSFAGVIFAGGPREITAARAREVLAPLAGTLVRRVGVVAAQSSDELLRIADTVGLDVLQFANGLEMHTATALLSRFSGAVWSVLRLQPGDADLDQARRAFDAGAEAVVLDALVPGRLGGSGVTLDWTSLRDAVATVRRSGRVVLAGGLRPENVARAVELVAPDVVDVSSGVEVALGIKDPQRMRAFGLAVRAIEV